MAEMLILEFTAPGAVQMYEQVNKLLGIDPSTGAGDWPTGILRHQAGATGDTLTVVESWESQEAQDQFMRTRLQPALAEAHMPPPTRVTWLPEAGSWPRG